MGDDLKARAAMFRALPHPARRRLPRLMRRRAARRRSADALGHPYRERGLRSFFQGGRLTTPPAQLEKVVTRGLGRLFEPGRASPEREVSAVPGHVYSDAFTLRREIVALGALACERVPCWRVTPEGRVAGHSPETADTPAAGPLE